MSLKTSFCMGIFISMVFVLSCSKDKLSNPTPLPTTPNDNKEIAEVHPGYNTDNTYIPVISQKEVNEIIYAKELLRALIKESLIQLLFNSHFNPDMPLINTRMTCTNSNCLLPDCGCPFQDESLDPDINVFPQLISLKYYDANDCTCTLATSPTGLEVFGEMQIKFSDPFSTTGHKITLYPQDDFIVDGYDIDGDSIELENIFGEVDTTLYNITALENVTVTRNGDVTDFNSIGSKSKLYIVDVGSNHGDIANAYGLLDDIFRLRLRKLSVTCSNGETIMANSSEDLVYDMACSSIEDGMVIVTDDNNNLVATYDYGAPAMGSDPGVCDDSILVTIPTIGD